MYGWVEKKKESDLINLNTGDGIRSENTSECHWEHGPTTYFVFCFGAKSWVTFYLSTFRPVLWVFFHAYAPAIEAERIHVLGLPVRLYILPYNSERLEGMPSNTHLNPRTNCFFFVGSKIEVTVTRRLSRSLEHDVIGNALREFLKVWNKLPLGLEDEMIRPWRKNSNYDKGFTQKKCLIE